MTIYRITKEGKVVSFFGPLGGKRVPPEEEMWVLGTRELREEELKEKKEGNEEEGKKK